EMAAAISFFESPLELDEDLARRHPPVGEDNDEELTIERQRSSIVVPPRVGRAHMQDSKLAPESLDEALLSLQDSTDEISIDGARSEVFELEDSCVQEPVPAKPMDSADSGRIDLGLSESEMSQLNVG